MIYFINRYHRTSLIIIMDFQHLTSSHRLKLIINRYFRLRNPRGISPLGHYILTINFIYLFVKATLFNHFLFLLKQQCFIIEFMILNYM